LCACHLGTCVIPFAILPHHSPQDGGGERLRGAQQERKSGSDSNNAGLPRGAGIRAFQQRVGILDIGVSFALTAAVEGALRAYIEHAKMAWPG